MLGYYCFMNIHATYKWAILTHTELRMAVLIEFNSIVPSTFALFLVLPLMRMFTRMRFIFLKNMCLFKYTISVTVQVINELIYI